MRPGVMQSSPNLVAQHSPFLQKGNAGGQDEPSEQHVKAVGMHVPWQHFWPEGHSGRMAPQQRVPSSVQNAPHRMGRSDGQHRPRPAQTSPGSGQTLPQPPQFCGSERRSRHSPLQQAEPGAQTAIWLVVRDGQTLAWQMPGGL
jgi:hypothetical protein